jgi:hypothetical protein
VTTPIPRWRKALPWLAATHLFIALLYSSHLHVEHFIPDVIERPIRIYGNFTGAHAHFNFFAPMVVSQVRVNFKLGLADGSVREIQVATPNIEVNQRLATMFNFYLRPTAREPLVQSWAQYMLATNPEAQWVQTRVELLEIPTLEDLKSGRRARWIEIGRNGAIRNANAIR